MTNIFALVTRLQDVLQKRLQDGSSTSSRPIQHVFETYCEDDYLQKDFPWSHFWEIYGQDVKFPRVNSLDIPILFSTVFLKHFMKWLLLQTKTLLLKAGVRKGVAVSVDKESINKSSSKNVFLRF